MADTQANTPSLTGRVRSVGVGAPVIAIHFLDGTAAFVLGEEALVLAAVEGEERRIVVHEGGILAAAGDGKRVITGGDDGRVVAADVSGAMQVISTIESAIMVQVSRTKTTSGTTHRAAFQRSGVARSMTSQVTSTGTAVPVWSGDRSTIWVALSWGASIRPAASSARARPCPPFAFPLASSAASRTSRIGRLWE